MRSAYLIAGSVAVLAAAVLAACGSDDANTSQGTTTTTTTTTTTSAGGAGGDMTTTSAGGAGGMGGAGGQGGGMGGAGGAAPLCQSLGDACSTCLHTMCQDLYCTCYNNAECTDLVFTCLAQCDPAAPDYQMCTQDCATMHSGGVSNAALLGGCSDQNCAMDCPASGIPITPCSECLFTNCPNQMNTCFADPECVAILQCAQACPMTDPGNPDCPQDCAFAHPDGLQEALGVLNCSDMNCTMECQF